MTSPTDHFLDTVNTGIKSGDSGSYEENRNIPQLQARGSTPSTRESFAAWISEYTTIGQAPRWWDDIGRLARGEIFIEDDPNRPLFDPTPHIPKRHRKHFDLYGYAHNLEEVDELTRGLDIHLENDLTIEDSTQGQNLLGMASVFADPTIVASVLPGLGAWRLSKIAQSGRAMQRIANVGRSLDRSFPYQGTINAAIVGSFLAGTQEPESLEVAMYTAGGLFSLAFLGRNAPMAKDRLSQHMTDGTWQWMQTDLFRRHGRRWDYVDPGVTSESIWGNAGWYLPDSPQSALGMPSIDFDPPEGVSTSEIWDAARRLTIGSDEGFQDRLNTWGQTVSRYVKTRRDLEGFAKKSPETLTTQDLVEIVHLKEIERGLEGRLQGYTTWGETLGEAAQTQSLRKRISDTSQVLSYRETGLPRAPVAGGVETILDQTPKGLRKTIKTGPDTYRVERRTTKEGSPATKKYKVIHAVGPDDEIHRFVYELESETMWYGKVQSYLWDKNVTKNLKKDRWHGLKGKTADEDFQERFSGFRSTTVEAGPGDDFDIVIGPITKKIRKRRGIRETSKLARHVPFAFHSQKKSGKSVVHLDKDKILESFKEKPWLHPKLEGVEPLPDIFQTPEEWFEFIKAHEIEHVYSKQKAGQTVADYENEINQRALHDIWPMDSELDIPRPGPRKPSDIPRIHKDDPGPTENLGPDPDLEQAAAVEWARTREMPIPDESQSSRILRETRAANRESTWSPGSETQENLRTNVLAFRDREYEKWKAEQYDKGKATGQGMFAEYVARQMRIRAMSEIDYRPLTNDGAEAFVTSLVRQVTSDFGRSVWEMEHVAISPLKKRAGPEQLDHIIAKYFKRAGDPNPDFTAALRKRSQSKDSPLRAAHVYYNPEDPKMWKNLIDEDSPVRGRCVQRAQEFYDQIAQAQAAEIVRKLERHEGDAPTLGKYVMENARNLKNVDEMYNGTLSIRIPPWGISHLGNAVAPGFLSMRSPSLGMRIWTARMFDLVYIPDKGKFPISTEAALRTEDRMQHFVNNSIEISYTNLMEKLGKLSKAKDPTTTFQGDVGRRFRMMGLAIAETLKNSSLSHKVMPKAISEWVGNDAAMPYGAYKILVSMSYRNGGRSILRNLDEYRSVLRSLYGDVDELERWIPKDPKLVDELNNAIESAAKDVQKYFQHYDRRRQRLNIEDWSGDDLFAAPSKSTIGIQAAIEEITDTQLIRDWYLPRRFLTARIEKNLEVWESGLTDYITRAVDASPGARDAGIGPNEIRKAVEEITETILHEPFQRKMEDQGRIGWTPSSLKKRTLILPDNEAWIQEFLQSDVTAIIDQYHRSTVPSIVLRETTDIGNPDDIWKWIEAEYKILKNKFPQERISLNKRMEVDRELLQGNMMLLLNRYAAAHRNPVAQKWTTLALGYNYLRQGGGFMISSFTDPARFVWVYGMQNTLDWVPRIMKNEKLKAATAAESREAAVASEFGLSTFYSAAFGDMGDEAIDGLSNSVRTMRNAFFAIEGLAVWNQGLKMLASSMTQIEMMKIITSGKITPDQRLWMRRYGLDDDLVYQMRAQWEQVGSPVIDDVAIAETSLWQDRALAKQFAAILRSHVDDVILTPGQLSKPFHAHTFWGRLLYQYKTHMFEATNSYLLADLTRRDAKIMHGVLAALALGTLVYSTKQLLYGKEISSDPKEVLYHSIDRSGILGAIGELNNVLETLTTNLGTPMGIGPAMGYEGRRYYSTPMSLLGPTAGGIQDLYRTTGSIIGDDPIGAADVGRARRAIPTQNWWLATPVYNWIEQTAKRWATSRKKIMNAEKREQLRREKEFEEQLIEN